MPHKTIDLDPTAHLTVGVLGEGDELRFVLQGSAGGELVTLTIDREQTAALSEAIGDLLSVLQEQYARELNELAIPVQERLYLLEPVQPLFPVAHFQLAYHAARDRAVVIAVELLHIQHTPDRAARVARFWVTREQLVALARRAEYLLGGPDLLCPFCGQPVEPEGTAARASTRGGSGPLASTPPLGSAQCGGRCSARNWSICWYISSVTGSGS
ncbi:MAG: DUF3090 family protein [Anaerolineae bacterium]|nr:DUF3090 family protein [Anaerolineae bacterium]